MNDEHLFKYWQGLPDEIVSHLIVYLCVWKCISIWGVPCMCPENVSKDREGGLKGKGELSSCGLSLK